MGTNTDFTGAIRITPCVEEPLATRLKQFMDIRHMKRNVKTLHSAFISKNDIFPPPELASPSDDDEIDLVRLEKVRTMMRGIDRRTRSKALPGSMEDDDDE